MKPKYTLSLCLFLFLTRLNAQSVLTIGTTTVICDTIVTGIDIPWEIVYGPDNHIWMTERRGLVSRIDPVSKTKTTLLDITATVYNNAESGLLALALHPDFVTLQEVFLVYTFGTNAAPRERLVKYTYSNGILQNEQILVDSIIANTFHDGSRLMFMPDKTLLMTTGDAGNTALAQNMNSLNGKVLRVNTDGTVPADNPFPGSYIYSFGHRNPQGLVKGPNGSFYISEHGPTTDDEFQLLEKGRNYGWPDVEGFCNLPAEITFCTNNNVKEPLLNWSPTIAPSDLVYYSNVNFPEFHDHYLMSVLKEKKIVAIKLNPAGTVTVSQNSYLSNMFGRLRDICVGSNGEIYLATNGETSSNNNPNTHSLLVLRPAFHIISVKETEDDNGLLVYPTYAKEKINIEMKSAAAGGYTVKIRDLCGKICSETTFNTASYICPVNGFEDGLYILTVEINNTEVKKYKLIIAK